MNYQLPADSLFNESFQAAIDSIADVPEEIKAQIREEAVLAVMNRLESSLRLLLYATTPGKEPPTAEKCHQILNVWRYELEHRVHLVPDTYCGAVQRYAQGMENSYTIEGRCEVGDLVRIRVPCWRMFEKLVVRGEAERMEEEAASAASERSEASVAGTALPPAPPEPVREEPSAAVATPVVPTPAAAPESPAALAEPVTVPEPAPRQSPTPAASDGASEPPSPAPPASADRPEVRRIGLVEDEPVPAGEPSVLSEEDREIFAELRGLPPAPPRSE